MQKKNKGWLTDLIEKGNGTEKSGNGSEINQFHFFFSYFSRYFSSI